MNEWLSRTELLVGCDKLQNLSQSHILVVGLGGVGAYAAEMLVRSGIGKITIADADTVSESNLNRQLLALRSTLGRKKTDVMRERLLDINPQLQICVIEGFIKDELTNKVLDMGKYDYVVDAIDTLSPKLALIKESISRNIPVVSSMGAGGKMDPTKMEICDISKTHHCPLAHMLRKRLHKIGIYNGFTAVFSSEQPNREAIIECEEQNKKSNIGTISYLPALFGIGCASVAIRELTERQI
ncbi:MAG: tRNA threonylcarbamoyladenosine dehydratase [Alistipes sp.]|nr:tRNA threonylcarbamoyladenosine dehydratase [Candidatus Alistipes equi]